MRWYHHRPDSFYMSIKLKRGKNLELNTYFEMAVLRDVKVSKFIKLPFTSIYRLFFVRSTRYCSLSHIWRKIATLDYLKPSRNKKAEKFSSCTKCKIGVFFYRCQLPAVKKETIFGAAQKRALINAQYEINKQGRKILKNK